MGKPIFKSVSSLFLAQMIVAVIVGAALWLMPGRTLTTIGWVPELVQLPESDLSVPGTTFSNPIFVRIVGAAVLAVGLASYWGWRSRRFEEVSLLIKLEAVFCGLGTLAILAGALRPEESFPPIGWGIALILAAFALAWCYVLVKNRRIANGVVAERPEALSSVLKNSIEAPRNYLQNLEETTQEILRLTKTLPEGEQREQLLAELRALDAIADVTRLALDARTEEGAL